MTAFEIISVAQSTGGRLDAQWAVFITVHLALLGGIIYVDRPLRKLEKAGAILIYGAFAFFNYRLIVSLRDLLERCADSLAKLQGDEIGAGDAVAGYFSDLSNSGHFAQAEHSILAVHVTAFLIVLMAILLDRRAVR